MPPFGPIKREELISCLRQLRFTGPYAGGRHQFMVRGNFRVRIPNPQRGDIGRNLLSRILKEAGIDRAEWEDT